MHTSTFLRVVFISCCLYVYVSGHTRVVDLSHTFNEDTFFWPAYNQSFTRTLVLNRSIGNDRFISGNDLLLTEHLGTHMDAPKHFAVPGIDQWYSHDIPPERLVGKLHVIELADEAAANRDYEVTVADIEKYETIYGKIQPNSIVLLNFDHAQFFGDRARFFGSEDFQNPASFHYPGLIRESAELLAARGIVGFGTQTPSADRGQNGGSPDVHLTMLPKNIWMLEMVGDLTDIPPGGGDTILTVGVIKTENGSGGPARLLAIVNEDNNHASRSTIRSLLINKQQIKLRRQQEVKRLRQQYLNTLLNRIAG